MKRAVVVKLGSNLVVGDDGLPRRSLIGEVAAALGAQVAQGVPVAVVSSGAIALGSAPAGLGNGRKRLDRLQAASALGQAELQRVWHEAFAEAGLRVAQVLLTSAEIAERQSYVNVRNALRALFALSAVPILNENDATSTDEISFGDNDVLAAQVAVLLRASRLILLTAVEGVLARDASVIADGADVGDALIGRRSLHGSGGIESKIRSAQLAAAGGVETVIASPASLGPLLRGERAGTRFGPAATNEPAFKLWLRYGKPAKAGVEIDEGAARALRERGRSLLAVGVVSWTHDFRAGDGLDICWPAGTVIARGISSVDADELTPRRVDLEVVHRDKLVLI